MDNKDVWHQAVGELEHLNRTLEKLLKVAYRLRQREEPSIENEQKANGERGYDHTRIADPVPHSRPGLDTRAKPGYKWYQGFYWPSRPLLWWKVRIETIAFFFAMGYAVVTFEQWKDARDSFKKGERPWIGPNLEIKPPESIITVYFDGSKIEWHLAFKNYGNSPALHASWHTQLIVNHSAPVDWPAMERRAENLDLSGDIRYTVFQGQIVPNPGQTERNSLDPGLNGRLNTGEDKIILIGLVKYGDEFGSNHTTTMCLIYNPPRDGIPEGWFICPVSTMAD